MDNEALKIVVECSGEYAEWEEYSKWIGQKAEVVLEKLREAVQAYFAKYKNIPKKNICFQYRIRGVGELKKVTSPAKLEEAIVRFRRDRRQHLILTLM